jgi:MFS superfamily sulfate permease-like transporter
VDAVGIGDVDYTGAETLIETNSQLKERRIRLVVAGLEHHVRRGLDRAGVTAAIGEDAYFDEVRDVLEAYRAQSSP